MISPARSAAFDILLRVEGGGWASDLLASRTAHLDARDAALASEIVYGAVRRQAQLDFVMRRTSHRESSRQIPAVRVALRMAIYQLLFLDRVPAHAAVDDAVELVKAAGEPRAAGFVNAVMRRGPKLPDRWPDRALEHSMPEWLLAGWEKQFGADLARTVAETFLLPAETYVRDPPPDHNLTLAASDIPGAFRVIEGDARQFAIQDAGSQSIVPLLELQPGQNFLDVCSAPGNKTAQALERGVAAVACDRHLHRLKHVPGCRRVVLDATEPLPFRAKFDRILVDAPCSGTGTLGRNPEIRWRLTPDDIRDLHGRQVRILRNALELLAPGGRLVYSTCSLERKENEEVVARVLRKASPDVRLQRETRRFPGRDPGDGFYAAVINSDQA